MRSIGFFAIGYVLGTRAGRERYGQIMEAAQRLSERFESYSTDHRPATGDD